MKRIFIALASMALAACSSLFAQTDFRSASGGVWSDPAIWEKNEAGVWLKPDTKIFPGDSHDRDVNVTIDDGSLVTVTRDQVVHVNSLSIINGRIDVDGLLIIGPYGDEAQDPENSGNDNPIIETPISDFRTGTPQLLQNVPNPLAPQYGYETTIRFFLDREYSHARLVIYDQLGHAVKIVFDESNPQTGWHQIKLRLDQLQSGTFPVVLELPNATLRRMLTVVK
ncbi:MAG: hypothetical protein WCH46_07455 [bacterium]